MSFWEGHPGILPALHCHIWTASSPANYPVSSVTQITTRSLLRWFKSVVSSIIIKLAFENIKKIIIASVKENLLPTTLRHIWQLSIIFIIIIVICNSYELSQFNLWIHVSVWICSYHKVIICFIRVNDSKLKHKTSAFKYSSYCGNLTLINLFDTKFLCCTSPLMWHHAVILG